MSLIQKGVLLFIAFLFLVNTIHQFIVIGHNCACTPPVKTAAGDSGVILSAKRDGKIVASPSEYQDSLDLMVKMHATPAPSPTIEPVAIDFSSGAKVLRSVRFKENGDILIQGCRD